MIDGHGDDLHLYQGTRINFSSNIYAHADLEPLIQWLKGQVWRVAHYPEPSARSLECLLADMHGVSPDEVLVTSGATDAIWLIAQAYRHMGTCRVGHPTFSEYQDACDAFGYREDAAAAVYWLCNPNNPTGSVIGKDSVVSMASRHKVLVIDQSYEDYTLQPMMTAREAVALGNVLQVRSMTKRFGVPGLRLGYIVAPTAVIAMLRNQYRPWAINALAIEGGKWLLAHGASAIPDLRQYLTQTRRLCDRIDVIDGVIAGATQTNFMLCRTDRMTAAQLKHRLATEYGMLIRDASNFRGLTPYHFRVAAQSPDENDALVAALTQIMTQR